MEKQRVARQAALVKQLECGCPDSTCADGKSCSHPMRRISAAKGDVSPLPPSSTNSRPPSVADNNNQVSSTTGSGSMLLANGHTPRVYSRDSRNNHQGQCSSSSGNTPPLVLSLSQIQGGGGLLILNSNSSASGNQSNNHHQSLVSPVSVAGFVCSNARKSEGGLKNGHVVLKQEAMDTNQSSSNGSPAHNNKIHHQRHTKMELGGNLRQSMFENVGYSNQGHGNHQTEVVMSSAPSTPSKHMDTTTHDDDFKHQNFCAEAVVVLQENSHGTLVNKSNSSMVAGNGFFNETLDLSQEDIQRTLSANMPLCSEMDRRQRHHTSDSSADSAAREIASKQTSVHHEQTHEINPMDFINSCDVVVSPTHVVDDDVFVNLDAFDMLGEFPDLEVLDSGHAGLLDVNPSEGVRGDKQHVEQQQHHQQQQHHANLQNEGSAKITDYSPEWAYPEGGVKVLVTGPWHSAGPYTVLFDTFPVPTTLVQSGVLRCYCPGKWFKN